MVTPKELTGRWGELLAQEYYIQRGFSVCDMNWRCRYGEIDLICQKMGVLYFIEVKTRNTLSFGYPEEAITVKKKQRMMLCADEYLHSHLNLRNASFEIHVVAVYRGKKMIVIKLYTDL